MVPWEELTPSYSFFYQKGNTMKKLDSNYNFVKNEEEILKYWEEGENIQ